MCFSKRLLLSVIYLFYQLHYGNAETGKDIIIELCSWEAFKPKCSGNEIVLINSAKYGRMNVGKCLSQPEIDAFGAQSKDPRYFGCFNDVTDFISNKCSVEKQCEVFFKDFEGLKDMACIPGLKMYLEIKYSCLPLIGGFEKCHVFAFNEPKHLLGSLINSKTCGSTKKPLLIEAPKGQKVKFTHITIGSGSLPNNAENIVKHCELEMGLILEKGQIGFNVSICENGLLIKSDRQIFEKSFTSKENLISVIYYPQDKTNKFLLEITAEGCLDIIPPEDTWLKRNNDDIVIGCYSSKKTWYLRCDNGRWTGTLGNCSNLELNAIQTGLDESADEKITNVKLDISSVHQTLIIIAICGFGVVVCTTIVCVGLVCLKRLNSKDTRKQTYYNVGPNFLQNSSTFKCSNNSTTMMNTVQTSSAAGNRGLNESFIYGQDRAVYADGAPNDDERYQVLDKEKVAKERIPFV